MRFGLLDPELHGDPDSLRPFLNIREFNAVRTKHRQKSRFVKNTHKETFAFSGEKDYTEKDRILILAGGGKSMSPITLEFLPDPTVMIVISIDPVEIINMIPDSE